MSEALANSIDALLPQTQCRQCGYAGCRPYAQAVAAGRAGINQCPPGGEETIRELAALLDRPVVPLAPEFGVARPPLAAVIDEAVCIGCTLCIQACPVDAIAGAAKLMHTVIAAECTGCELCIPPCPVDCIAMVETAPALLAEGARGACPPPLHGARPSASRVRGRSGRPGSRRRATRRPSGASAKRSSGSCSGPGNGCDSRSR